MKKDKTCKITRWQLLKQQLNNLDPEAFAKAMAETEEGVVLDVRTPGEFSSGSFPRARNLDYLSYELVDRLEELEKSRPYFVFCRTGRRSIRVCTLMKNSGFARVYNLEGGLVSWKNHFGEP